MGDLTGEYFARVAFIKAVAWLSKYQKIDGLMVSQVLKEQEKKTKVLKQEFNKIKFSNL